MVKESENESMHNVEELPPLVEGGDPRKTEKKLKNHINHIRKEVEKPYIFSAEVVSTHSSASDKDVGSNFNLNVCF